MREKVNPQQHLIAQRFEELKRAEPSVSGKQFFSRQNRKNLEWKVLCSVCHLLKSVDLDRPVFAEEKEPPDFTTYREDGSLWSEVEITEVMELGRKRDKEVKRRLNIPEGVIVPVPPPIPEPFLGLRESILKKAKKTYAAGSVLMVYFNIGNLAISYDSDYFSPHLQDEAERQPFEGVADFKRVFVLSADMTELVELLPHPQLH